MRLSKPSPFLSCNEGSQESFLSCIIEKRPRISASNTRILSATSAMAIIANAPKLNNIQNPSYSADFEAISLIVGIDPGVTGAIALISSGKKPKLVGVYDFPLADVKIGNKLKSRIDLVDLSFLIESYAKDINLACIEEVGQIGTKADPFSSFVFGFSTGSVHGVLASHGIRIQTVKPLVWKCALGLDADKNKAIQKAIKLFPESQKYLTRKKDHGRAEAILIAHFAWVLSGEK